ncbi:unnamed protein product [Chrysoparadoxa australica]
MWGNVVDYCKRYVSEHKSGADEVEGVHKCADQLGNTPLELMISTLANAGMICDHRAEAEITKLLQTQADFDGPCSSGEAHPVLVGDLKLCFKTQFMHQICPHCAMRETCQAQGEACAHDQACRSCMLHIYAKKATFESGELAPVSHLPVTYAFDEVCQGLQEFRSNMSREYCSFTNQATDEFTRCWFDGNFGLADDCATPKEMLWTGAWQPTAEE